MKNNFANDTINFKFGANGSMRERTTPTKTEFYPCWRGFVNRATDNKVQ